MSLASPFRVPEPGACWRPVLFDMDGTLIDSAVAIVSRLRDTLSAFGVAPPDDIELRHLIGPPTRQALASYIDAERLDDAVTFYRGLASREGSAHVSPFPGIPEALARLAGAGVPLALATSKPQGEAERLAHEFALAPYLSAIVGSAPNRPSKADVVGEGLARLSAPDIIDSPRSETSTGAPLMVGDRVWDVEGAAEHDVPTLLVRWGYAREAEFPSAFAAVDSVVDLENFILGQGA